jgi:hypothetical protein
VGQCTADIDAALSRKAGDGSCRVQADLRVSKITAAFADDPLPRSAYAANCNVDNTRLAIDIAEIQRRTTATITDRRRNMTWIR